VGVLEVGRAGAGGVGKGVLPVLADGAVVATLRSHRWKEAATAVVGEQEWVFTRRGRELTGRRAADPEDAARLRARQTSLWKGTWQADLEGTGVEVRNASLWKGTHRFVVDGRVVAESGITGGWAPRPTLTTEADLPLAGQVFLLWLEMVVRRRNSAAVAAGAGAAVAGVAE
jgi:hypothetical protein